MSTKKNQKKEVKKEVVEKKPLEIRNMHRYFISSIGKGNNIVRDIINVPYIVQDPQAFAQLENDWRNHKKDSALSIISFSLLKLDPVVYFNDKPLSENDINADNSPEKKEEDEIPVDEFNIEGLKN